MRVFRTGFRIVGGGCGRATGAHEADGGGTHWGAEPENPPPEREAQSAPVSGCLRTWRRSSPRGSSALLQHLLTPGFGLLFCFLIRKEPEAGLGPSGGKCIWSELITLFGFQCIIFLKLFFLL